jgi:integrase
LNSDVFTGIVSVGWKKIRNEYLHSKKVAGYVEDSIYEAALTLRHFERIIGKCNSKQITQSEIEFKELKEDEKPVKSLSTTQIKKIISASKRHKTLRMRILIALGTGLRLGDIYSIMVSDIDFENNSVTTRSRKTRKSMGSRPVPVPIMAELKKYVSELDAKQEKIFNNNFSRYTWTKIRRKLGLEDYTFHDLRKTFGSVLAQHGVSTVVIQKLLEHSSPDLTTKVYTNVDPVLRHAVDQIPVGDWL